MIIGVVICESNLFLKLAILINDTDFQDNNNWNNNFKDGRFHHIVSNVENGANSSSQPSASKDWI